MYFAVRFNATITEVIEALADPDPRDVVFSEATDERKIFHIVDEDLKIHLRDSYVLIPVLAIEELETLAFGSMQDSETGTYDMTRRLTRHENHRGMADATSKLRWIQQHARKRREMMKGSSVPLPEEP